MLNPNLDRENLAAGFAVDDRIRVENVLQQDIAEQAFASLDAVPFEYIFTVDGRPCVTPASQLEAMDAASRQQLQRSIANDAAKGIGYYYCGYMFRRFEQSTSDPKLRFLHGLFDYLNSSEMLDFIGQISARDDLLSADAQFTRYTPGQFLTRHSDAIADEGRKVAYVLSFTRDWHPDWGGLLQFYCDDGAPRDAWSPLFNSLTLFDVRHVHSVTYVAPFAAQPRLSLTGWFRSKPLPREPEPR